MLIRALQSASGIRCDISKRLLLRTGFLSPISSVNLGYGRAKISIFVVNSSPAPPTLRELSNPNIIAKLSSQDFIPPGYELIYRSNLPLYLMLSQTAIATAIVGGVLTLIGLSGLSWLNSLEPEEITDSSSPVVDSSDKDGLSKKASANSLEADLNNEDEELPKPNIRDFDPDDLQLMSMLVLSFAVLLGAMLRLQNMVPTRIYTKANKHCIAVFYGSIIPGRITHHEFMAGLVKSLMKPNSPLSQNIYRDGSGKKMILMDTFFRYPADLNRLLGKGYDKL